jgi:hypothetical protein
LAEQAVYSGGETKRRAKICLNAFYKEVSFECGVFDMVEELYNKFPKVCLCGCELDLSGIDGDDDEVSSLIRTVLSCSYRPLLVFINSRTAVGAEVAVRRTKKENVSLILTNCQ